MSAPQVDRQLIRRAVAGDPHSLERLLYHYFTPLCRYLAPKIPAAAQSVVDAEDILQQTFAQAFRDIGEFEHPSETSFFAWLKTIADHRLLDTLKLLKRKKRGGAHRPVHTAAEGTSSSLVELVELLSDRGDTPSVTIAREEAVKAVKVAMAGLPQDYQDAIRLRYLEGKNLNETAEAMNRSPGAVRGLLDRAKERMRAALGRLSLYMSVG